MTINIFSIVIRIKSWECDCVAVSGVRKNVELLGRPEILLDWMRENGGIIILCSETWSLELFYTQKQTLAEIWVSFCGK